jgi:hypothetical protein
VYLDRAPLLLAVAAAAGLSAFGARVFRSASREAASTQVSLMPFVFLSPLAFALQECVERLFVGTWPFAAVLAPTFMPGLLFQLPFACAAFLIARWLLRTAERLHVLLFGDGQPGRPRFVPALAGFDVVDLPRTASLATCQSERGPPQGAVLTALAIRS